MLAADPADPAVALADSLLPRLEQLAGLSATGPLHLARRTREQLRGFIVERLEEDLPPEEALALRDVYALLGALPDTLDLRALLVELYTEQVVGYYDPAADTLFLVEGMPAEQVEGVLAHELVHALQDQHVPLDSLLHRDRGNDARTAAQAALEGHATMVMLALSAERATGRALDPARLPDPEAQLAGTMEAQSAAFPVFGAAPPFIRHTLLFPYVHGASFVRRLWLSAEVAAWAAPLGPLLPASTEQVLFPEETFLGQRDAPTELTTTAPGGAGPSAMRAAWAPTKPRRCWPPRAWRRMPAAGTGTGWCCWPVPGRRGPWRGARCGTTQPPPMSSRRRHAGSWRRPTGAAGGCSAWKWMVARAWWWW